jgi:hypothetical protein
VYASWEGSNSDSSLIGADGNPVPLPTVSTIESTDSSVTVTGGTGPTVNLSTQNQYNFFRGAVAACQTLSGINVDLEVSGNVYLPVTANGVANVTIQTLGATLSESFVEGQIAVIFNVDTAEIGLNYAQGPLLSEPYAVAGPLPFYSTAYSTNIYWIRPGESLVLRYTENTGLFSGTTPSGQPGWQIVSYMPNAQTLIIGTLSTSILLPQNATAITVTLVGGGAAGGAGFGGSTAGGGGGGGAGGTSQITLYLLYLLVGSSITAVAGAGGTKAAGAAGGNGGASSVAWSDIAGNTFTLYANGGTGGNPGTSSAGGTGGAGGTGTLSNGTAGGNGDYNSVGGTPGTNASALLQSTGGGGGGSHLTAGAVNTVGQVGGQITVAQITYNSDVGYVPGGTAGSSAGGNGYGLSKGMVGGTGGGGSAGRGSSGAYNAGAGGAGGGGGGGGGYVSGTLNNANGGGQGYVLVQMTG